MTKHWQPSRLTEFLPLAVLVVLLLFTLAKFVLIPYAGFDWNSEGAVSSIYVNSDQTPALAIADRLVTIGAATWQDFANRSDILLFDQIQPGEVVPLRILRNGQTLDIAWRLPGFNQAEFWGRTRSEWFLPYVFWLAGLFTLLFLRPKDERWRLFIAFNFVTAIWLAAGSSVTQNRFWLNILILKATVWLSVPLYWHLHWYFPRPLGRLDRRVMWGVYGTGGLLAVLEILQLLPRRAYYLGFAFAVLGSLVLLVVHFVLKRDQRQDITLVGLAGILTLLPVIAMSVVGSFLPLPEHTAGAALLALPLLPLTYIYAAYRKQLGGLELRANRAISLYAFLILMGLAWIVGVLPFTAAAETPGDALIFNILAAMAVGVIASEGFPAFQRFVERKVFGIRLPPSELIEGYLRRIVMGLDPSALVNLLKLEVAPSLLIRQSALIVLQRGGSGAIYLQGVEADQIPAEDDIAGLLAEAGRQRLPSENEPRLGPWVKVIVPLIIDGKPMGLWLLGRRDPDDYYSQRDITTLQSLANQTAIALTNMYQAERLRGLYQNNVDQREVERARLARELHDHSLNELKLLVDSIDEQYLTPEFFERYETIVTSQRQIITDLRPVMLTYGLYAAVTGLADELQGRLKNAIPVTVDISVSESPANHAEAVVLHLYRIVQQACENAIRHARPQRIKLYGKIEADFIDLTVEDDGVGFETKAELSDNTPGAQTHYGIRGMLERATIINAEVAVQSTLGKGTLVRVVWKAEGGGT